VNIYGHIQKFINEESVINEDSIPIERYLQCGLSFNGKQGL
jgi:hypothetical protein